jgi:hypothetical protein
VGVDLLGHTPWVWVDLLGRTSWEGVDPPSGHALWVEWTSLVMLHGWEWTFSNVHTPWVGVLDLVIQPLGCE